MEEKSIEGAPAKLADWADYQKDSVISRKIIQASGGSVAFFAFDEGQKISSHTAPFDALLQVVEGEAEVQISQRLVRVSAGEILRLPANQPHAVKAVQRFKMVLTILKSVEGAARLNEPL